jgi:RNA polymerase sigma factor (sigma-70 family)
MYNKGIGKISKTFKEDGDLPITIKIMETDCSQESDVDLLTLISWRKEDNDGARRAFGEFYSRYFKLLTCICMRKYRKQIGDHEIEDLVNTTFLRVFESAATKFKTSETDFTKLRHHIGAWLGKIAHNLFRMQLRGKNLSVVLFENDFDPPTTDFDPTLTEEDEISPEYVALCKRLQKVLDALTDQERDILLTRFENYHGSGGKEQFRSDDLERLANDWELTKDHVRQIYHRTFQKVKKQLS